MTQQRLLSYEELLVKPPRPVERWQLETARYDFGGANPGPDLLPIVDLAEAAREAILALGTTLSCYPPTEGPESLRQFIARHLYEDRGISVSPEAILVTNGSAQGIILALEALVQPGDVILGEQFFFHGALRNFRRAGAQVIGIPTDDYGMRIDALASTLDELRRENKHVKFIYTIPTFQNPEGTVLPLERRQQMLRLAQEHGTLILEDDCYVHQRLDVNIVPPAIASLDGAREWVIYVGTFSKIVAPGVRVGWVTAPPPVLERMAAYKQDVGNSRLSGLIIGYYLERHLKDRLSWLNQRLRAKRDTLIGALQEHFGPSVTFRCPAGGMFLWACFPETVDLTSLEATAKAAGVRYYSGIHFSPANRGRHCARLNYSLPTLEDIPAGVALLARVLRESGAL